MSELAGQTIQQLFKQWRSGDAEAGQAMASRFSDWYYAIAASRLGDPPCRQPLETACRRFAEGVSTVTEARLLPGWSHDIIVEELKTAGERAWGGDFPNNITGKKKPSDLLAKAVDKLTPAQVTLLDRAYDRKVPLDDVKALANEAGGYPIAVLQARYALKRVLRSQYNVQFTEVPDQPNLDWGPLPLYECGRMDGTNEEKSFETWMLSDLSLCKDIAEFSSFAIALRGGALKAKPKGTASSEAITIPPPPTTTTPPPQAQAQAPAGPNKAVLIGGVVVVAVILAVIAAMMSG